MAVAITFAACKKNDKSSTPTAKPISTDSVQTLSDSIQFVRSTTKTQGDLPASGTSSIVLEDNTDTVIAVNGGYAVIIPSYNAASDIYGFYIRIKGANTYYTLEVPVTPPPPPRTKPGNPFFTQRALDYAQSDSIIAIKLPASLAAGTFKVEYEAYDKNHATSNITTAIVQVYNNNVTTADYKALTGYWSVDSAKAVSGSNSQLALPFMVTSSYYVCDENRLYESDGEEGEYYAKDSIRYLYDFSFTGSGRGTLLQGQTGKQIDLDNSTCGSPVYMRADEVNTSTGSLYFNAINKQAILITDNNGASGGNYNTYMFTVVSVSATKLEIALPMGDASLHYYYTKK